MNNEYYINFLDTSEKAIKEGKGPAEFQLKANMDLPLSDKEAMSARLSAALNKSIENLDEELTRFEKNFSGKHTAVFWASDYNDVFSALKKIFKTQKAKSVRLPNVNASTIFREIGIKYFLHEEKMELSEDGEVQFFVADMLFSDTGTILLLNQSANSFAKLNNAKTNIFFTTIDRITTSSNWAEIYQQTATYRTRGMNQDYILFKGSQNCNNYLFIIDNQRTSLLTEKNLRQSLTCLQCGRCNDVCPVLQTIGEEPYNNVFTGPVANIVLPHLETMESYKHVVYACTLCGRCEEVCPISLPIRDMIIDSRQSMIANGQLEKKDKHMMAAQRKILLSRSKMNSSKFIRKYLLNKYLSPDFKKTRKTPPLSDQPFNKLFH